MICEKCGFEADDDSLFCPKCGEKLVDVYSFELERTEPSVDIFSYEQTLKEQPAEQESEQNSVMISGEKIFEMLDREYEKIKKQQAEQSVQESTNQLVSEPATIPPVNTQAFVGKGKKIKHNSPAEKRVASSSTGTAFRLAETEMKKIISEFVDKLTKNIDAATHSKLKMKTRNTLKKDYKSFNREVSGKLAYIKSLEQPLGTFGGKETVMLEACSQLWGNLESSLADLDSMFNELLGVFKMGAIGSAECSRRTTQAISIESGIERYLDMLASVHKTMSDEVYNFDFNAKVYMKTLNSRKSVRDKELRESRFSSTNVMCIFYFIISCLLIYYFISISDNFHDYMLSILCGSMPIGFYHLYHLDRFYGPISDSLETIKELWLLILFPPLLAVLCINGILASIFCILGGIGLGWMFMIVDPIKIILGYQCVKENRY